MKAFLALLVLGAALIGCSKKEEVPPPSTPPPANPAPAAEAQPAPQAVAPTGPSAADLARMQQDAQANLAAAQAAMRQREYDKAAQAIVTVQRYPQLTPQQSQAAQQSMYKLQSDLANALASGDPKAKAAAEILRRSAMRR